MINIWAGGINWSTIIFSQVVGNTKITVYAIKYELARGLNDVSQYGN